MIDTKKIENILSGVKALKKAELDRILANALLCKGISLEEAASLLAVEDASFINEICNTAYEVKKKVFGRRIVLFAPLYVTNFCSNGCLYCGFRAGNSEVKRKSLDEKEIIVEAKELLSMGFKRVLLVAGEDPSMDVERIASLVRALYDNTGMRIVHVNAAPMTVDEFRVLKNAGVGVYQSFQETYHRPTYELMHPKGRKKDYDFRITAMQRAMEAGFEDVGIGALLGLYDARYDVLGTIAHSNELFKEFGAHAHTISVPRLRPAEGMDMDRAKGYAVSDLELKKITAIYRLSVPTAGVVISTREGEGLRNELVKAGASQMSAGSKTSPGAYKGEKALEQFSTNDKRTLLEVMTSIIHEGGLPSLCTTCYRSGRVGSVFHDITSAGDMEKFCAVNAVLTLKEYALDNQLNGEAKLFESAVEKAISEINSPEDKMKLMEKIKEIENGKRDVRF